MYLLISGDTVLYATPKNNNTVCSCEHLVLLKLLLCTSYVPVIVIIPCVCTTYTGLSLMGNFHFFDTSTLVENDLNVKHVSLECDAGLITAVGLECQPLLPGNQFQPLHQRLLGNHCEKTPII